VLAKVIFSFTPDIIMSPLALPRHILDSRIESLLSCTQGALRDVLVQLRERPTFEQQWPDQYKQALARGKSRIIRLERIRNDRFTMADILQQDQEIYDWWLSIN
jgi:hypothetical protein